MCIIQRLAKHTAVSVPRGERTGSFLLQLENCGCRPSPCIGSGMGPYAHALPMLTIEASVALSLLHVNKESFCLVPVLSHIFFDDASPNHGISSHAGAC